MISSTHTSFGSALTTRACKVESSAVETIESPRRTTRPCSEDNQEQSYQESPSSSRRRSSKLPSSRTGPATRASFGSVTASFLGSPAPSLADAGGGGGSGGGNVRSCVSAGGAHNIVSSAVDDQGNDRRVTSTPGNNDRTGEMLGKISNLGDSGACDGGGSLNARESSVIGQSRRRSDEGPVDKCLNSAFTGWQEGDEGMRKGGGEIAERSSSVSGVGRKRARKSAKTDAADDDGSMTVAISTGCSAGSPRRHQQLEVKGNMSI